MLQPNPAYVRELIEVVRTSPFPNHIKMWVETIDLDEAVVKLTAERFHLQAYGIVHGGVLATLIDTATFWAVYMRIPQDAGLVNIDLKLNYLKPVEAGLLTAESRAIRSGRSVSYAEARVWDDQRVLVAHGTSTLMQLPGRGLKLKSSKFLDD